MLLSALSFFATYSVFSQYDSVVHSFHDIVFSVSSYVAITTLGFIICGCFKTKVLAKVIDTACSVFLAVVLSHLVIYTLFEFCPIYKIKFKLGVFLLGSATTVLVLLFHIAQNLLRSFYLKSMQEDSKSIRTLIIGAGFTGKMVYHELVSDKRNGLTPVCFVDDDKDLISTKVCDIDVYGPTVILPELCKKHNIGMIVFAIPSCPPDQKKHILSICSSTGCDIRIIPSIGELERETTFFKQARTVNVEQLLGRDSISIENSQVSEIIQGKTCLVTGGGGSIGSELCRQIVLMNPKKVVIVDIYENNAYDIQQELVRNGFKDSVFVEIASVRDKEKMRLIFEKYKFDIIFHAAAHKHVPLMETNPEEAVKNNVVGTYNIAHLAHKYNVSKMVLISTDKAVNPTNVMGASKRVCEKVMQYMSQTYPNTKFMSVRFGNVLGSNGSVIPLFTKQIEAGGPVTVTHPEIIRYFMTIPEAVSLVLEAGTMSSGGETFVLDMGQPVKIVTLAENLIRMYGYEHVIPSFMPSAKVTSGGENLVQKT
ncbi:MAG: polysaccharide biosynthesis protein, partial [Clostridia bacterium]|nr:polysaccharide biosynthesis protein [Clostridia bacterium]